MNRLPLGTRRWLQGLTVVLAAGVCAALVMAVSARAAQEMDAAAKALVRLDEEWSAAAGRRDVEKVASFYAEDAVAYPPNEPAAVGRDAAKKVWAAYLADESYQISWKATRAEVCKSGELGFTSGTYEDSFKAPDGATVRGKGKFLCVWKKQSDGSWKAVHDMWNADAK